ncbi:hypothetical protein [Roseateles sp. BYS96W]|uniref:Uncharacterized protein n=1 Tax=Pelomonas nitida TaxID=3299027 RepID=A0ABW7GBD0_9BURK
MHLSSTTLAQRVRFARKTAIICSLCGWFGALALCLVTSVSALWLAGLIALGLVPYLLSLHVVEPWLERQGHDCKD